MEDGSSAIVKPSDIKVIKKASEAQPGNDLEITTQGDGATVGISEAIGFVKGIVSKDSGSDLAGQTVMVKAVDYTSKGDEDMIEISVDNKKEKIKKKYITDIIKLNEIGVYNTETDTNNNPKTKENIPDELTGFVENLIDSVNHVVASLSEIKKLVNENSSLSSEAIDKCVAELQSYSKSLSEESEVSASANAN